MAIGTSEKLAHEIESLVQVKHLSYLDAVLYYCQTRNIDPVDIAPHLGDKIKSQLAADGQRLHLLPKENTLPF